MREKLTKKLAVEIYRYRSLALPRKSMEYKKLIPSFCLQEGMWSHLAKDPVSTTQNFLAVYKWNTAQVYLMTEDDSYGIYFIYSVTKKTYQREHLSSNAF